MLACGNAILATEDGGGTGVLLSHQESLDWVPDNDLKKAMSIMLFRNPYQGAAMLFRRELVSIACPIPDATGYHDKWLAMVACMKGGMEGRKRALPIRGRSVNPKFRVLGFVLYMTIDYL